MESFLFHPLRARVRFGVGARSCVAEEASALGGRFLVLATPRRRALAEDVRVCLGDAPTEIAAIAAEHVPAELAREGAGIARAFAADVLIAIGGGSAIGLGKAVALETGAALLAIPTTFSGSEMTPIWGVTEAGLKRTGRDAKVQPAAVIYDPELLSALPVREAAASGMNAIAHCVEALYAPDGNPLIAMIAEEGIRMLGGALPRIVAAPASLVPRGDGLYGAWLSGMVLGAVSMSLHHKLCHTLGGSFSLPHALTHAIVLPHALAYNEVAARDAAAHVARALGGANGPAALHGLLGTLGLPTALRDIGMPYEGLVKVADLALANPYSNPAPLERGRLLGLLDRAWCGAPPVSE